MHPLNGYLFVAPIAAVIHRPAPFPYTADP